MLQAGPWPAMGIAGNAVLSESPASTYSYSVLGDIARYVILSRQPCPSLCIVDSTGMASVSGKPLLGLLSE